MLQCWSCASYPKSTALFSQKRLVALSDSKAHHQAYTYNTNYKCSLPLLGLPNKSYKTSTTSKFTCLFKLGLEDIAGIAHNKVLSFSLFVLEHTRKFFFAILFLIDDLIRFSKVLIAAGVSAAVGQFSKPFTSLLLYGKDFDVKAAFQAGGFPSTHSSVCFYPFPLLLLYACIFAKCFVAAHC